MTLQSLRAEEEGKDGDEGVGMSLGSCGSISISPFSLGIARSRFSGKAQSAAEVVQNFKRSGILRSYFRDIYLHVLESCT